MRLHLHPTRNEAVTVEDDCLDWWLLGQPVTLLKRQEIPNSSGKIFGGVWDSLLTPDGEQLALATSRGEKGVIELREWGTGNLVDSLYGLPDGRGFTAVCFSPDSRWVAAADSEERILLMDRSSRRVASEVDVGLCYTSTLAFDPESGHIAAVTTDQGGGAIGLFRVGDGVLRQIHRDLNDPIRTWDLADTFATSVFSHSGTLLAVSAASHWGADTPGWTGEVMLLDVERGLRWSTPVDSALVGSEQEREGELFNSRILFSEDDSHLITGSPFGRLLTFDVATGKVVRQAAAPSPGVLRSPQMGVGRSTIWALLDEELVSFPLADVVP